MMCWRGVVGLYDDPRVRRVPAGVSAGSQPSSDQASKDLTTFRRIPSAASLVGNENP